MIQALLDGCDTAGVFAADDIPDLFRKGQTLFVYDFLILDDVDRDLMVDKAQDVQIHKIDRTLDLHDVFFAHFAALGIFDDGHTAVKLIEM